jgi:hypothetical protein
MTKRSILSGSSPTVIIKAGRDIKVKGKEGDRVESDADGMWGLKVERRDGVIELSGGQQSDVTVEQHGDVIEIHAGKDCDVRVPLDSTLKLHAGRDAEIEGISGSISVAHVGRDLAIRGAGSLGACQAGGGMNIESQRVIGDELKFTSGRHLRCHVHDIDNTQFEIKDMGGYWEMAFGEPATRVRLKAGSDVTLVIDEKYGTHLPDVVGGLEVAQPGEGQRQE